MGSKLARTFTVLSTKNGIYSCIRIHRYYRIVRMHTKKFYYCRASTDTHCLFFNYIMQILLNQLIQIFIACSRSQLSMAAFYFEISCLITERQLKLSSIVLTLAVICPNFLTLKCIASQKHYFQLVIKVFTVVKNLLLAVCHSSSKHPNEI